MAKGYKWALRILGFLIILAIALLVYGKYLENHPRISNSLSNNNSKVDNSARIVVPERTSYKSEADVLKITVGKMDYEANITLNDLLKKCNYSNESKVIYDYSAILPDSSLKIQATYSGEVVRYAVMINGAIVYMDEGGVGTYALNNYLYTRVMDMDGKAVITNDAEANSQYIGYKPIILVFDNESLLDTIDNIVTMYALEEGTTRACKVSIQEDEGKKYISYCALVGERIDRIKYFDKYEQTIAESFVAKVSEQEL